MVDQRPDITEIVSRYTELRRSGREYLGLCPLHAEKSPSFTVSEEKGVFHCFGCGEGGDVIRFVEKIENVDFKGAIAHLGITEETRHTPAEIKRQQLLRETSRNLAAWALDMADRIGSLIREVGQREYMAQRVLKEAGGNGDFLHGEIQRASREWIILTTLEEDLLDPNRLVDLWQERELIEQFVGNSRTYSNEEIENMHPPLPDDYRQRLTRCVRGES